MENRANEGDPVDIADLVGDYIKKDPVCPSGGDYDAGDVGTDPTCSIGGDHSLDAP
jgi:hypothetical protein